MINTLHRTEKRECCPLDAKATTEENQKATAVL
jgi:hypothetical protein